MKKVVSMKNKKIVEISGEGRLIIISDLHGNLDDYKKYLSVIEKLDKKDHVVITGDFIHGNGSETDGSIEILESIKDKFESEDNFHVLLGNHEWAHVVDRPVFKGFTNQKEQFEDLLKEKFDNEWEEKLEEYTSFFRELPLTLRTENKLFISHAGPPTEIKNIDEIANISDSEYLSSKILFEILWNRSEDYKEKDLDSFLDIVDCNFSIVGHTPVDGIKIVHNKQLIISSSYSRGKKAYIQLDLKEDMLEIQNILDSVIYLT